MKQALILITLLSLMSLGGFSLAQDMSADEVVANLEAAAESLEDAQLTLTGSLIDPDGSEIALEIFLQIIPETKASRAEFFQPDALADNFIVLDGDAVYNYVFLTNQVTIFPTDDPDALGGLFPDGNVDQGFDFTFNPEQLFRGWTSSLEGYSESPVGNIYEMRFFNEEEAAIVAYVDATIVDGAWYPYTMTFYTQDDEVLADITLEDFVRDQGLDPGEVTYIPDDAEVIDER